MNNFDKTYCMYWIVDSFTSLLNRDRYVISTIPTKHPAACCEILSVSGTAYENGSGWGPLKCVNGNGHGSIYGFGPSENVEWPCVIGSLNGSGGSEGRGFGIGEDYEIMKGILRRAYE